MMSSDADGPARTRGTAADPATRSTYRHGDLRQALIEAGMQLARDGGPDAVVLREATRRAGVAPNAAYRHFANRQDLFEAVRAAALRALAVTMESKLSEAAGGGNPADAALRARANCAPSARAIWRSRRRNRACFAPPLPRRRQSSRTPTRPRPAPAA